MAVSNHGVNSAPGITPAFPSGISPRLFLVFTGVLLGAEILASRSVWCGTPTDWSGEPLHFSTFEIPRLTYWALSLVLATSAWLVVWRITRFERVVLNLVATILTVGVELSTSIWSWSRLHWTRTTCPSLTNFRYYFWEHLTSWVLAMLLGLVIWRVVRPNRTISGGRIAFR
jgi:hypothetical protein